MMDRRKWIECLAVTAALAALAWMLFGCMSGSEYQVRINPATGEGTATLSKVALVEPVAGNAVLESEVIPVEESGGWLGLALAALTGVGALQFAGPKSWANWLAVLKPSTSWGTTGHALAANLGLAHTPKEAKSNETQEPKA